MALLATLLLRLFPARSISLTHLQGAKHHLEQHYLLPLPAIWLFVSGRARSVDDDRTEARECASSVGFTLPAGWREWTGIQRKGAGSERARKTMRGKEGQGNPRVLPAQSASHLESLISPLNSARDLSHWAPSIPIHGTEREGHNISITNLNSVCPVAQIMTPAHEASQA